MKFGRLYSMYVQGANADHTIDCPLTCKFQVKNNSLFSCGEARFQIYNLSQDVRNDIYKDAYEQFIYKQIRFAAGYQADTSSPGAITLPIIFQGNITQAYSYRQGPDWITEITALDGGFALDNGTINLTKPSPYNFKDALSDAVKAMPQVKLGVIGTFDLTNSRGVSFNGNPWDLITQKIAPLEGRAFINKEKVNIVRQWEYIADAGTIDTISPDTGMIGTPLSQEGLVKVRLLFEPRLEVMQQIKIDTTAIPQRILRNGSFLILGIVHSGTASGAICETMTTEVTCFQPNRTLQAAA